ncbi:MULTISPECIES: GAF domain-containing hybrid sensor histidine kinase/response regulator [unclassified Sphingomonas]|uniref:GAF domain-containing hybrid sensor histidine kinase/response regulator n=1 Tax=unclassified Sphingomonas TaxID=196159 RepID=UPI00138F59EA|nr:MULTISPECIES: ATP-binding protein [unclassified Sphingomonas]
MPNGHLSIQTITGAEIAAHDWAAHPLGPIEGWPVSLRSLLAMMLSCPTPMFLAWGPELHCFYNDAYRPLLGVRLPGSLGERFDIVWSNIWDELVPLVDKTIAGGNIVATDMKLDLARTGEPEDSWWSFTYSPAFDDAGKIAGLLCVTGETTARVVAERERAAADERLQLALSAGRNIGAWDWDVQADIVRADTRFALLYGVDPQTAEEGAPIGRFFEGIHPDDLVEAQRAVERAMDPDGNGTFIAEYRVVGHDGGFRWVSAQGRCTFDDAGRPLRFPGVSYDIDDRKRAELAALSAKAEREFVLSLSARQRAATDPDAIMRFTARSLGEWLRVSRVAFARIAANRVRYMGGWNDGVLPPLIGEHSLDRFGRDNTALLRAGRTVVSDDFAIDPAFAESDASSYSALSGLCVPLRHDGRLEGLLIVGHCSSRHWLPGEIALLQEVAEISWVTVQRADALLRLEAKVGRQDAQLERVATELHNAASARAAAETQVRQLQKMEAVGQLTGGIAHDFNNMLAVVIGGLDMIERRIAAGRGDVGRYVEAAKDGATRAAALTQRLLAFSRQSPLSPEPVEGNRLIADLTELLTRTLGEPIAVETVLSAGLWRAEADRGQLENAIVNLAVNARDAMADGGKLTIETANAHVGDDYAREADMAAGQYVMIAVTDTGTGMAPEVLAKAFEPFFTTKPVGRGTGLGLSQVFGFVRQSRGHVRIYSEPGVGTTVRLYLPRFYGEQPTPTPRATMLPVRRGDPGETVLVVEDESRVRSFSVEVLRDLGYAVLHASNGPEALALLEQGVRVTLLFTDVVMPGMTGRELADRALAMRPGLRVLYTTGYTRNAVVHNGVLDPGTRLLPKPFGVDELARKVREALDA